jgi:hypothetical protein
MKHRQFGRGRRLVRRGLVSSLVALAGLAGASPAAASVTIGQLAPASPPAICGGSYDILQPTVTSGSTYVVPAGGVAITSWSTSAAAGAGQELKMKVFRKIAAPARYRVIAHDGPRPLIPGVVNEFPVDIPVQPGDVLGLNNANAAVVRNACLFAAPGNFNPQNPGDLADGQLGDFDGQYGSANRLPNIAAEVRLKPLKLGNLDRNKDAGTATLAVNVPAPGKLSLTGPGVRKQRAQRATASRKVTAAGTVKLRIKAKGQKKRKLNATGRVKVKIKLTFTPSSITTGEVTGDPLTRSKRVKLLKG